MRPAGSRRIPAASEPRARQDRPGHEGGGRTQTHSELFPRTCERGLQSPWRCPGRRTAWPPPSGRGLGATLSHATPGRLARGPALAQHARPSWVLVGEGVFKDPSSKFRGLEPSLFIAELAWLLESDVFLKESLYLDDLQKRPQTTFFPSLFEAHPLTLQRGEE